MAVNRRLTQSPGWGEIRAEVDRSTARWMWDVLWRQWNARASSINHKKRSQNLKLLLLQKTQRSI